MAYHIIIFTASTLKLGSDGSGIWKALGGVRTVAGSIQMAPGEVRTALDVF